MGGDFGERGKERRSEGESADDGGCRLYRHIRQWDFPSHRSRTNEIDIMIFYD